jgi:hypothetical protein
MGFLSPIEQVPMDDKFARCLEVDPDCVEGQNYADKLPSSARVASLVDEASDTRSCSYTGQSTNESRQQIALVLVSAHHSTSGRKGPGDKWHRRDS